MHRGAEFGENVAMVTTTSLGFIKRRPPKGKGLTGWFIKSAFFPF